MSEQTEFLKDLGTEESVENKDSLLDKPLEEQNTPAQDVEETPEESAFKAKNRRERRMAEKIRQLREEAIVATTKLQTITESQQLRQGSEESDYLKRVEKIYGDATPEAAEATKLLKEALSGLEKRAVEVAMERLEAEKSKEAEAVKKEEQNLEKILEEVEDDHGIDMGNDGERKGYLSLLEKLSPKDAEGNIIEYADPDTTAEIYLSRKEKSASKAKDLANKGMVRSGAAQTGGKLEVDATERFLREHGII